jgi:hypothetical protein
MRMTTGRILTLLVFVLAGAGDALASGTLFVDEIRLGVLDHNVEPQADEEGVDINAELLFARSGGEYNNAFANIFFRPRAHLGASLNTIGDTSEYYFGLTWDYSLTDTFFLEASFGGAVHDGPLDEKKAGEDAYGCSLNFRESASVGVNLDANWRILATVDHMSNANLCDHNAGLTNAGVRVGYKF